MFGSKPFGGQPFGGGDLPDQSSFTAKTVKFEGQLAFTVTGPASIASIIGKGDRELVFAAIIRPWRLQQG